MWPATHRSTQPSTLGGTVSAFGLSHGGDDCSLLAAYRRAYGLGRLVLSKDRRPLALFLHLSREPGDLSHCSKHDDTRCF